MSSESTVQQRMTEALQQMTKGLDLPLPVIILLPQILRQLSEISTADLLNYCEKGKRLLEYIMTGELPSGEAPDIDI